MTHFIPAVQPSRAADSAPFGRITGTSRTSKSIFWMSGRARFCVRRVDELPRPLRQRGRVFQAELGADAAAKTEACSEPHNGSEFNGRPGAEPPLHADYRTARHFPPH